MSTCCAEIHYDPEEEVLTIVFQKRGTYQYFNVDLWTATQVETATSQGKDFNNYIRDRFEYNRIA